VEAARLILYYYYIHCYYIYYYYIYYYYIYYYYIYYYYYMFAYFSLAPSAELTEQLAVLKQRSDCMLTYADVC
jgi:hypothetical protein